jgi:hypothetical protein
VHAGPEDAPAVSERIGRAQINGQEDQWLKLQTQCCIICKMEVKLNDHDPILKSSSQKKQIMELSSNLPSYIALIVFNSLN